MTRFGILFLLTFAGGVLPPVSASLPTGGSLPGGKATATEVTATETTATEAAAILSGACMKCHNSANRAGGIDFSTRVGAAKALGAGSGKASRLVTAVTAGQMPPTGKLSDEQIIALQRWVKEGAVYPQPRLAISTPPPPAPLWSLQPVRCPVVPHTRWDALSTNPIDHFILDKLTKRGLHPSPPASRLALLRRVTIDLTGLPPTTGEIDAFLADRWPGAYERVVDRLLASPGYGERWGRHWLDIVRYGDSNGYEQNHLRANAWPYRDYVIQAFNQDKPYPQFIAEQLAGDVLGKGDPGVEAATGFLVAGVHDTVGIQTEEGTRQQRANDLDDMVSTTGAAFLGLTVGCARCHDHKFDPIPQKDYYRLAAVFAGVQHGDRLLSQPEKVKKESEELNRQIASRTGELEELDKQARAAVLQSGGHSTPSRLALNAYHNVDDFPPTPARFVRFTVLATLDGAEPCLDELQVFGPDGSQNLALASAGARATASSLLPGFAIHQVEHLNDGKLGNEFSWISSTRGSGWAQIELPKTCQVHRVAWSRDGSEMRRFEDRLASAYRIEVSEDGINWRTVSTEAGRASSDKIPAEVLLKAMTPQAQERRKALTAELDVLHRRAEEINASSMAYSGKFTDPEPTFVLRRGDVMQRVEPVTPGALSQVAGLNCDLAPDPKAAEPVRRLSLARWLGDPRNPLTARVMVNRIWQYHFGRGIVGTTSDFGNNGEKPTHPELLDWLASDFMSHGWRIKRLQKMIVTSSTYRQASDVNPRGMAVDAGNQLLWHVSLRRMEAEAIRDAILAAGGKLDRRMGGPGFPLFQYKVVNVAIYGTLQDYSPDTWRRSVYQESARGIQDDLLGKFDCPESAQRAPRRENTTTALQALTLLNGPFILQQASFFADRVTSQAGAQPSDQVDAAFRLALGRKPETWERETSLNLLHKVGLPALCRALMNTNEFLYY